MSAIHKFQGHEAENSPVLHSKLQQYLSGEVIVEGKSDTKTDILVGTNRVSLKTTSGKNTQVWLPSQITLFEHLPKLLPVKEKLISFLGNPGVSRVSAHRIDGFDEVLKSLDEVTKDKSLLRAMLLANGDEEPVQYITWVKKMNFGGGFTLVNADKLVEYIAQNCRWQVAPSRGSRGQTTLHLIDQLTGNKMFHLQAKGSGTGKQKHNPMFHIHNFWPAGTVIAVDEDFFIPGI